MAKRTERSYDLTQGNILSKLLMVALPIMGTQLMQMAYNLTDMFWLGRVGSDAVAASGTAGMFLWLSMALLMLGRMGAEIGVSQSLGKGDADTAKSYSQNALLLGVALGVMYGLFLVLLRHPLVRFMGIKEANVAADTANYLLITGSAIPATFVTGALTGTFNGSGNARTPFFINAVGLVVNMILDPLMIFELGWGIEGAAIATSLAQVLVCALFLVAIKVDRGRPFSRYALITRIRWDRIRQIFRWSIPIGIESALFTFMSMLVARFVADFGASAIAVQRVGSQVESLSWLIGGGFSSALTAFVGQNFGAGCWTRIHRGFRISLLSLCIWLVGVTLALFFGARLFYTLLLPEPHIVEMGVSFLRILASCQVFASLEYAASGAFRGIGRTTPPSIASVFSNALRVPLAYFLSQTALGLDGIWWGVTIGAAIRGIWMFVWYLIILRQLPKEDQLVNETPALG